MLNIIDLSNIYIAINLRKVCSISEVNYYTIKNKIHRFRKNPSSGQLSPMEVEKLSRGLEKIGLKISQKQGL